MSISVNFELYIYFHGYWLQELDDHIQCNDFGENLMKISRSVEYIQRFSAFPGDTFSTWKMETWLCGNL